jgi:hypothetical protein
MSSFSISTFTRIDFRRAFIRRRAAVLSLLTLAILGLTPDRTHASYPLKLLGAGAGLLTSVAAAPGPYWFSPHGGFWVQVDGRSGKFPGDKTLATDGSPVFGNVATRGTIIAIPSGKTDAVPAPPNRNGYWVVSAGGTIHARGDAPVLCDGNLSSCSGYPKNPDLEEVIVAGTASRSG